MSEAAVMGATGTVKTMADGTFRIVVDIEPRFAQLAFSLFGAPGTSVALAKITNEAAIEHDNKPVEEKPKGGPLAKLAGQWCGDSTFWEWIGIRRGTPIPPGRGVIESAAYVRSVCGVDSRAELDHDERASMRFQELIRLPFMTWMQKQKK